MEKLRHLMAAIDYAAEAHGGQYRRGTAGAYAVSHPLRVMSLVLTYSTDMNAAIAAVLHDVVEDCLKDNEPPQLRIQEIRDLFGNAVADIVHACSNNLHETDELKAKGWFARKTAYAKRIQHMDHPQLLVTLCDKICNLQDMLVLDSAEGRVTFNTHFHRPIADFAWYHKTLLRAISEAASTNKVSIQLNELLHMYRVLVHRFFGRY